MSSKMKHTPGPWQVAGTRHTGDLKIGRNTRLLTVGPDGDGLAMVFFDIETGRGQADARLIAAAPELLEACKNLLNSMVLAGWKEDPTTLAARAAIDKAKGETID